MREIVGVILDLVYRLARLYWFIFRPQTTGVNVVIKHNREILLVLHSYGDTLWRLPGGGVHKNEAPENAAKREVMEEVGIPLEQLTNYGHFLFTGEYKRETIWVFASEVKNKYFLLNSFEIKAIQWFDFDKLPTPQSAELKKCLDILVLQ
jgi:8-oxo-dGTP pyrophosphatase MutT (NUDIX family)